MQAIRYRITSLSPLLFASNTGDPNMVATLDYIPGTCLRGMLANEYIKRKKIETEAHKDHTFYRWFLKGELKITNAYIVQEKGNKIHRLLPIPLSIQREKGEERLAYDLLLQNEEFDKLTVGIGGYGRLEDGAIYIKSVKKSLNFHHARDRERGVSKKGHIFNYESIDEGQTFEGFIIGNSEDLKEFTSIIKGGIYYLGRSRNNQYGKIKFEIISNDPEYFESEIDLKKEQEDKIILTLLSDTIIYNKFGYSTTDIKDFEEELKRKLNDSNIKINKAFIKQTEEEGFISVWKLKTLSEVCFKAGSCFLLEVNDKDIIKRLQELQKTGIGIRTHEGFGRFVIGWQNQNELSIYEAKDEIKLDKPAETVPQIVKDLVHNIIKEYLKKYIQTEAIEEAGDFTNLPSKSLLAKLEGSVKKDDFKNLLKNLKKTAKEKLEKCRNKDTDLYEFLMNFSINIKEKIRNIVNMENLCNEISYQPEGDQEIQRELEKTYLITFLSTMRKKGETDGG